MIAKLWMHDDTGHYVIDWANPFQRPMVCSGAAPGLVLVTWHDERDDRIIGIAHGKHADDSIYIGCMAFKPPAHPTRLLEARRQALSLFPNVKTFRGVRLTGKSRRVK